jgi:hypothetical protein
MSWVGLREDIEEMFSIMEGCLALDDMRSLQQVGGFTEEQAERQRIYRSSLGARALEYKKDYETRTKPRRIAERLARKAKAA